MKTNKALKILSKNTHCQVCGETITVGSVAFAAVHVDCAIEYDTETSKPCNDCFFWRDEECINDGICDDYDQWWLEAVKIKKTIKYIKALPGESENF